MATKKVKEEKEEKIIERVIVKPDYRSTIVVGIIAVFIILLVISNYNKEEDKTTNTSDTNDQVDSSAADDMGDVTAEATVAEYLSLMNDKEVHVFYIARPSCSYCVKFAPIVTSVIEDYGLKMYYINTDESENSADIADLIGSSELLEDFGTPAIAITENGEVTYANIGYMEEDELVEFLTDSKIITAAE